MAKIVAVQRCNHEATLFIFGGSILSDATADGVGGGY
jgi:hypothetical protein